MSSVMRFDEWQDSNGTTLLDGAGGSLTVPSGFLPAGSVLQVVSTTKTDTFTASVSDWTDITGLSATITPQSTSSKIIVSAFVNAGDTSGDNSTIYRFMRDATPIGVGDSAGSRVPASVFVYQSGGRKQQSGGHTIVDSPNTSSAITYKLQIGYDAMFSTAQTVYLNRAEDDEDANTRARTVSSITLMEIAG